MAEGRVLRLVNGAGMEHLETFRSSACGRKWTAAGAVAATSVLGRDDASTLLEDPRLAGLYASAAATAVVEHERIPFPSFPYEWPPEMLHAAAQLTLDLAIDLLAENLGLKDATPYNVLFRGPQPVFIDLLSFERREPGDPTWLPYAQFVRTFLLPLLVNRRFGFPLDQLLLPRRDGLEPEEVYRWLGLLERLRPPYLSLVTLPVWLAARRRDDRSIYRPKRLADPERARFIVQSLMRGLARRVASLAPPAGRASAWSGYMDSGNNYSAAQFAAKESFVRRCLDEFAPRSALDVGSNTGHFSLLAAGAGARVVAIDSDPVVTGGVWRQARAANLDVLPLVVNLTRPTPGTGWNNRECPSFLDRARGSFDAVFMLAVIHHMLVTERVPLDEIADLAAALTSRLLVIEFVAPGDSMFQRLVRGREELHQGLTAAVFETSFRRLFDIVRSQHLEGASRTLYLMQRKEKHG